MSEDIDRLNYAGNRIAAAITWYIAARQKQETA